ncbi:MAG: CBS domain-containing protein [Alphaproteobacteria bacterium]|nr:CBS domain-containing protein [Alphaproteobacteria bacterium]
MVPDVVHNQRLLKLAANTSVREAARQMAGRGVGAALVVDGDRLEGIFTERDLLNRVVARDLDLDKTRLSDVMTKNPATISADAGAMEALRRMHDGGFRHLPVLDGTRLVAIVSLRDFFGAEFQELEREVAFQENVIAGRP